MSIVNERKELLIKVNTSRKRTIPMVCVAVAIIAASSVFAVVSKKNNAVETKTPEPAKAVTTSAHCNDHTADNDCRHNNCTYYHHRTCTNGR